MRNWGDVSTLVRSVNGKWEEISEAEVSIEGARRLKLKNFYGLLEILSGCVQDLSGGMKHADFDYFKYCYQSKIVHTLYCFHFVGCSGTLSLKKAAANDVIS
ncbi:hypothetical protein D3C74_436870 [compost metagenome]